MARIIRAPFFLAALIVSFIPATFIFATVTVGTWIEKGIAQAGIRMPSDNALMMIGMAAYLGLGIVLPAYVGSLIAGWVGGIGMVLGVLAVIAMVDRW